ncbi:DMWD protein, partial [Ibidorhyncha struthersii]|nr:DMWD protein [Ibidorhyncha struthersii]
DLHKPIDKRIYKGTQPTCHDFNQFTAAADTIALLVGFSAGQVQCLDLVKKDASKLFNEERLIDKTKVTFVKWLPETERLFLASHASGHLYLYDAEQPCGAAAPQYNLLTQGEGFSVFACKSKPPRNPLLNPDGRYVVTGGEDDLVTVWSFAEGRVVARGHGHKSWVNAVAFDPFTGAAQTPQPPELSGGEEEDEPPDPLARRSPAVTYRFGSAGQDTQFCLWDLTEDVLYPRPPLSRARTLTGSADAGVPVPGLPRSLSRSNSLPQPAGTGSARGPPPDVPPALSVGRFATLTLQERKGPSGAEKEHKRYHSLGNISRSGEKPAGGSAAASRGRLDTAKVLGTALCPRIHEVPLLEPLVCKKIAHERLTVLLFLEDCIVTACQE